MKYRQLLSRLSPFALIAGCAFLTSCAVNPVTGKNELSFMSESQELSIGAEQYGPSQQSQGGEYATDERLTSYVNEVGQRLAAVSDRDLPYEFVVLNNSVPNAWALPGGKIAVNRGLLLELNNEAELAAVLGHEIVHAAAKHGAQSMTRGTLLQGAMVLGAIASNGSEYSDYIVGASQLGAQLITQRYGRDAERESDYYGIEYMVRAGYDPMAAISLQETFVRLSEGRNSSWADGLFASHPPSQERVDNNRAQVEAMQPRLAGRDLELGEARYQQAIDYLKQTQPAYALFDEAQKSIAADEFERAMSSLNEAIKLVPEEAQFTGLKGDILFYQHRYQQAISNYNAAIEKDANYFDYYLGRGVAYARQGKNELAKSDLQHSADLLPTAIGMNELGKLSLAANDRANAKQYFQMAASSQGSVGQEAALAFTRLDIADNPATYVQTQLFADGEGRIYARVSNPSSYLMQNITIAFASLQNGQIVEKSQRIQSLNAQGYVDLDSGMTVPSDVQWNADQMRVTVLNAQIQ